MRLPCRDKNVDVAKFANSIRRFYSKCMKKKIVTIAPKAPVRRSPFDVTGLAKNVSRKEIIAALRESRKGK